MPRSVGALCAVAVVAAVLVALGPLAGVPHVTDEVAYTLQSKLFASGLRVGPAGDYPNVLQYPFWETETASYGVFPPGWPAVLAVGTLVGLPWLVNALLAGVLPWLSYLFSKELTDEKTAVFAAGVMALSPGVWLLAGSRMSQTSVLVALLTVAVVVVRKETRAWTWWLAGGALAYVVLARPYDAFLVGIPLILLSRRVPMVVLPGVAAALLLWDNHTLTGDFSRFPVDVWFDTNFPDRAGCNSLGFGEDVGCTPLAGSMGYTPAKAAEAVFQALRRFDQLLIGVPGGSLLAAYGAWKLRHRALLLIPVIVLGYALYWSPGAAYGARFWHPLYIVVPTCVALAVTRLPVRWVWLGLAVACVGGGSFVMRDVSDRYWCGDDSVVRLLDEAGVDEGVVFLQVSGVRRTGWPVLGVDEFVCNQALEATDGLFLNDPTHQVGGLQVRHAFNTVDDDLAFLDAFHPGATGWLITHDIARDERSIQQIR
ncbi:MAG: hypothetical protein GY913_34055 [Proteobacteria bacterium]|nr:hypothetical protein [Pseudomonadota bacterium]MCP4921953.1 hypothetical protein [Pseudomonadota bacterium]